MGSMSKSWARLAVSAVALAALATGCSEDHSAAIPAPPESTTPEVVVATAEASPADCPFGGTVVRSGLDENHNQRLDDTEVRTHTLVCTPAPAPPPAVVVVRLVAEPAGENCSAGGTAVQSGPDHNGNGALDDDEIANTDFVCGALLLTRFRPEPEGTRCIAGGLAFQVGRDRDHDDMLDDDEVEHTDFTCGDIVSRSLTISSADDVAALAGISVINGSVNIGAAVDNVVLPRLQHLFGSLTASGAMRLSRISAPELTDVRTDLSLLDNPLLATLDLPKLLMVGHRVRLEHNGAITNLDGLAGLTSIGENFEITSNPALISIERPLAVIGGDLRVFRNPQLTELRWTLANRLPSTVIDENGLTALHLTVVNQVDAEIAPLIIAQNPKLTAVEIDTPTLGSLNVSGNNALADLTVHSAIVQRDLTIRQNAALRRVTLENPSIVTLTFRIHGSLTLSGPIETLETGSAGIQVDEVCSILETRLASLAAIQHVGLLEVGGNSRLTTVSGVEADFAEIISNPALISIEFALGSFDGAEIQGNAKLEDVRISPFQHLDRGLTLTDNPALISVRAPQLREVGSLTLARNVALRSLDFAQLLRVDEQLHILQCPALTSVVLPELAAADAIAIAGNATLNHVAFDALSRVTSTVLDNNPKLPACEVAALFTLLPGRHEQHGNDETATCGPVDPGAAAAL